MEKEVFSDCGAWKNFHDLEDSLTLEELGELYDIAVEKQNRFMKMMAALQGVELEDTSDVQSNKKAVPRSSEEALQWVAEQERLNPSGEGTTNITSADDLTGFQYGLGYEVISSDG